MRGQFLTKYLDTGAAYACRRGSGRLYRKTGRRCFRTQLACIRQQLRAFLSAYAGFRRADIAIWADHPLYHCGYHRHYSGVFHLQKAIMIFRGKRILPFPFFQEKSFFFYEKYGSFLEKNTKKRYDKM